MDKGITQTSMDDIVKAAGYTKARLYVYFESGWKRAIFRLLLQSGRQGIMKIKKFFKFIHLRII